MTSEEGQTFGYTSVLVPDKSTVAGYSLYRGLDGKPAILLEVEQPRTAAQIARSSIVRLSVGLVVIGLAVLLLRHKVPNPVQPGSVQIDRRKEEASELLVRQARGAGLGVTAG